MKPFASLTAHGQVRRLHAVALNALAAYDLNIRDIHSVGMFTNAIFRLRTSDGQRYALRICRPGWRSDIDLFSEATWLQAQARETDIGAPVPLAARNGEVIVTAGAEGVPEPRRCAITTWIAGSPLRKCLTPGNLYKMGALLAQLHQHAATFTPPPGFTRRRLDRILARGEQDVLFDASCMASLTAQAQTALIQTRQRVERALALLYADPSGQRVIHNDLWHGNIKVHHGRLHPLDFEDTVWGYPVQDIAPALQDLMMDTQPEEYDRLQQALRSGYESRLPWPESYEGQIDTLRAGRMLWVANYVARCEREHLAAFMARLAPRLQAFLDTGRIVHVKRAV